MSQRQIDEHDRYVVDDFQRRPPFASFLPGIAGPLGIPLWAFYVNRGQGVASFGIEGKQCPIVEFQPANKAYQSVAALGFRTFLKTRDGAGETRFVEPFGAEGGERRRREMRIGANDFVIREQAPDVGLDTAVTYFSLPSEPFAALVRKVTITNVSGGVLRGELLDGLPAIIPFGVDNAMLKNMSNTAVAWMGVENLETGLPFYRVAASIEDTSEVQRFDAGHFYLGFAGTASTMERTVPLVDPQVVFGSDTALVRPQPFLEAPLDELLRRPQTTIGRTPCGFSTAAFDLAPGEELVVCSIIGHSDDISEINRRASDFCQLDFIEATHAEAIEVADAVTRSVDVATSSRVFDLYTRQCCLDNVLRGGFPLVFAASDEPRVYHLYARRHGDTERDYNEFCVPPEYYSEGNGAYRDANQNRRSDVLIEPGVEDHTIHTFVNLLQVDGYNPLELQASEFTLPEGEADAVIDTAGGDERLRPLLNGPFTPGRLLRAIEHDGIELALPREEFLDALLGRSQQQLRARHHEGFWVDHWTYNLDLIDSFLAIYPERKRDLFFAERSFTYFDNSAVVVGRDDRYVEVAGGVRQFGSVVHDEEKEALIASRSASANVMRTERGHGTIYRTSLLAKLFGLCALKFSTLDPWGMGIEMEADKPGWDDAVNGLPGMFGSSMSETFELRRLMDQLDGTCEEFPDAAVQLPAEVHRFVQDLDTALAEHEPGGDFTYWNRVNELREAHRRDVRLGYAGDEVSVPCRELRPVLARFRTKVEMGIERATKLNAGLPPTYFVFEPTDWQPLTDADGAPKRDAKGRPNVRVGAFSARQLPLFLEGVVKAMRSSGSLDDAQSLYERVHDSALYDTKLGMYKVNASLADEPHDIGRARAFPPGWLENESIFLHMHYKYLLSLLKAGLAEEFWQEARRGLVPFFDPATYGRSILEHSSFVASSAHPDPSLHGRGFVARLSGATAEFLSIWHLATVGPRPFIATKEGLGLCFRPELPAWLFRDDGTLRFTFLGRIAVVFHNSPGKDLFSKSGGAVSRYEVTTGAGELVTVDGPVLGEPWTSRVRAREVTQIDAFFA